MDFIKVDRLTRLQQTTQDKIINWWEESVSYADLYMIEGEPYLYIVQNVEYFKENVIRSIKRKRRLLPLLTPQHLEKLINEVTNTEIIQIKRLYGRFHIQMLDRSKSSVTTYISKKEPLLEVLYQLLVELIEERF